MTIKTGIISAVAGASLLGGVGVAAVLGGGSTTLAAAPAASVNPAAAPAAAATTPATNGATATAPAPAANPARRGQDCNVGDDGEWPDFATGRPAGLDAGDRGGVYLWHDDAGWHLRITHIGDDKRAYSGVLTTSGRFADVDAVKLERDDHLSVGPNDHVLSFRFVNYGGIDGIDFHTRCAPRITFNLRADGQELGTERVVIGHHDANPTSVPFTIERAR